MSPVNRDVLGRVGDVTPFTVDATSDQQATLASGSSGKTYRIIQGDTEIEVEALDSADFGGKTVREFYDYDGNLRGGPDGASANTPNDMEKANLSQLFFYDGPGDGNISLVVIHDAPDAGDGSVRFEFDDLPDGEWVVKDDPGETTYDDQDVDWNWVDCCTDGGAYRGDFGGTFWLDITPQFREGITSTEYEEPWVVVDGGGTDLERHAIDPSNPITITSTAELVAPDSSDYTIDLSPGSSCVEPSDGPPVCISTGQQFRIGPRKCEDGFTPNLISIEMAWEKVREDGVSVSQSFWIGIELNGSECIWWGVESIGLCEKLDGCRQAPAPNPLGVPSLKDAKEVANDVLDGLSEAIDGLGLPRAGEDVLLAIVVVALVALAVYSSPAWVTGAIAIVGISAVVVTAQDLASDDENGQA